MFANIDQRSRLAWVAFCLQLSAAAAHAQSKDAAREPKPIDVANACLARGDNVCVVRALEGKAKSAMELGLLIETYRSLEEPELARPAMEQYVQRFPDASRSHAYRRMLETMPQGASAQAATPTATAQRPAPKATPSTSAQRPAPSTSAQGANTQSDTSTQSARAADIGRGTTETKTPLEQANQCRAASDDHCIVRALEGKAQTAEELGMLCEAYRELGDNKRARAAMQQYIERFPKANDSEFYRKQLGRTH